MKKIILILTLTIILAEGMFASSDETAPENCPVPVLCALGALNIPACKNVKEVYQYNAGIHCKERVSCPEKFYVLENNQVYQYNAGPHCIERNSCPEKFYVFENNQIYQYNAGFHCYEKNSCPEKIYVLEVD